MRNRGRLSGVILVATLLSACAGSGSASTRSGSDPVSSDATPGASDVAATTDDSSPPDAVAVTVEAQSDTGSDDVDTENRQEIGPRVLDADGTVMMVVDSLDVSGDDILVGLRVVNGSDGFLNVSVDYTRYGPLLVVRDDRGNTDSSLAIEPAGIESHQIGRLGFRLHGPFDPDATEFTVELATNRGLLTTEPIPAPASDVVRWWRESPPMTFSDLAGTDHDRTIQVEQVVDRGTHVDVSVRATDGSAGFSIPDDTHATLTMSDGAELESLPPDPLAPDQAAQQVDAFTGILRFVGTLPTGAEAITLHLAGVDVDIPLAAQPPSTTDDPPLADLPGLRDLLDRKLTTEPLPTSTITIDSSDVAGTTTIDSDD